VGLYYLSSHIMFWLKYCEKLPHVFYCKIDLDHGEKVVNYKGVIVPVLCSQV